MTKLDKWLEVLVPMAFMHTLFIDMPKALILTFLTIFKVLDNETSDLIACIGFMPEMIFGVVIAIMILIQKFREWRYK